MTLFAIRGLFWKCTLDEPVKNVPLLNLWTVVWPEMVKLLARLWLESKQRTHLGLACLCVYLAASEPRKKAVPAVPFCPITLLFIISFNSYSFLFHCLYFSLSLSFWLSLSFCLSVSHFCENIQNIICDLEFFTQILKVFFGRPSMSRSSRPRPPTRLQSIHPAVFKWNFSSFLTPVSFHTDDEWDIKPNIKICQKRLSTSIRNF